MKHISKLRQYAAKRHASIGQEYEPGVPYWVHYFICELVAIAFNLGPRVRRVIYGHDLPEDAMESYRMLRKAGWRTQEARDIYYLTDEKAPTRAERKKLTLPKTAHGGYFAIGGKLCDRYGNYIFGLLSGSLKMNKTYRHEYPTFRHYLYDCTEARLLPLWYALDELHRHRPSKIAESDFESRPLRKLIDSWIARKEELLMLDKVDLLPEWHKLKALLDAELDAHK